MEKIAESILKFLKLDSLIGHVTGYVEARIELMKMEIREDVAKTVARAMVMVALLFAGFLFIIFSSIGLAHYLNGYFGQPYIGDWIVAGFYLFIFLLLIVFRKGITTRFESQLAEMIKQKNK